MDTLVSEQSPKEFALVCSLGFPTHTLRHPKGRVAMTTKETTRETLADYVRRILKEKGLTFMDVERLSEKEITAGSINKIVNYGMENLTAKTISALAKGLGESPDEIFHLIIGYSPQLEDSELAALFYNYGELSEEDKGELKLLLEVVDNEIERRRAKKK